MIWVEANRFHFLARQFWDNTWAVIRSNDTSPLHRPNGHDEIHKKSPNITYVFLVGWNVDSLTCVSSNQGFRKNPPPICQAALHDLREAVATALKAKPLAENGHFWGVCGSDVGSIGIQSYGHVSKVGPKKLAKCFGEGWTKNMCTKKTSPAKGYWSSPTSRCLPIKNLWPTKSLEHGSSEVINLRTINLWITSGLSWICMTPTFREAQLQVDR